MQDVQKTLKVLMNNKVMILMFLESNKVTRFYVAIKIYLQNCFCEKLSRKILHKKIKAMWSLASGVKWSFKALFGAKINLFIKLFIEI